MLELARFKPPTKFGDPPYRLDYAIFGLKRGGILKIFPRVTKLGMRR